MIPATYSYAPGVIATPGPSLAVIVHQVPRPIPLSLIVRIEAARACCLIYTRDGRRFTITQNLVTVSRLVAGFWRVHRAHLINPAYVAGSPGLVRHEGLLRLQTGQLVPVARRRKQQVYQYLSRLIS